MVFIINILNSIWELLLDSSIYILFGLLISGLLSIALKPKTIAKHLGKGRFLSVIKASLLGVPLPLCSCGVLPAAVTLKKQGANNGATTSFLVSTPESGVDSISISYALLDPILTIARPVAAFTMAIVAGITENLFSYSKHEKAPDAAPPEPQSCNTSDVCCSQNSENPVPQPEGLAAKLSSGLRYAFTDVWYDLTGWFFFGIFLAGAIMALIPDTFFNEYLGGGFYSMLMMLIVGIPVYICATASTPVAAALILKGVSPGVALVFLLAGPATNIASLTVLAGILGKRTTFIYLAVISVLAIIFGLLADQIYQLLNISPKAVVGAAAEVVPHEVKFIATILLLLISVRPMARILQEFCSKLFHKNSETRESPSQKECSGFCSCNGSCKS